MIASQNKRILINCVDKSSNGAEKGETSDKETFSDVVIVNNDWYLFFISYNYHMLSKNSVNFLANDVSFVLLSLVLVQSANFP